MLYTTPSPQRKKEPTTGSNKLRLFLKRSSEPLLNLQNAAEKVYQKSNKDYAKVTDAVIMYIRYTYQNRGAISHSN